MRNIHVRKLFFFKTTSSIITYSLRRTMKTVFNFLFNLKIVKHVIYVNMMPGIFYRIQSCLLYDNRLRDDFEMIRVGIVVLFINIKSFAESLAKSKIYWYYRL